MSSLFPSVNIGRMWKLRPLTLSIDQSGMLRTVETGELRKEAKVVLIFFNQPRNRVVGIDYDYLLPFQMRVRQVEQFDALRMSCVNVEWTDVILTLTIEKFTDNPNYGMKVKDIHMLTPEEREHIAGIIALVSPRKTELLRSIPDAARPQIPIPFRAGRACPAPSPSLAFTEDRGQAIGTYVERLRRHGSSGCFQAGSLPAAVWCALLSRKPR